MEPAAIPPAIADACLRISRELDLLLTGIDLKETPDGEFYAFEVNPCPGFLYYERHAGQPISAALADLLRRGAAPPRHHERRTLPP
jgi:glutathione synthase/RimK-type ligase-like ATP-grasp enzyme